MNGTLILSVSSACPASLNHRLANSVYRRLVPDVYAASAHCWHVSAFARYRSDRDDIEPPVGRLHTSALTTWGMLNGSGLAHHTRIPKRAGSTRDTLPEARFLQAVALELADAPTSDINAALRAALARFEHERLTWVAAVKAADRARRRGSIPFRRLLRARQLRKIVEQLRWQTDFHGKTPLKPRAMWPDDRLLVTG
jgi:hypothetical protein